MYRMFRLLFRVDLSRILLDFETVSLGRKTFEPIQASVSRRPSDMNRAMECNIFNFSHVLPENRGDSVRLARMVAPFHHKILTTCKCRFAL